jgi:hypothetical protein
VEDAVMQITRICAAAILLVAVSRGTAPAFEPATNSPQFAELFRVVKPQAGESRWAAVPWEISLQHARERAGREDKPLFVWRAGGGDVLGRA